MDFMKIPEKFVRNFRYCYQSSISLKSKGRFLSLETKYPFK